MLELLKVIRIVGLRKMVEMTRAYRLGWIQILTGFYTTRTLQALFNVGFFDELENRGRVDLEAFARQKGLDAEILKSLCDSLYALRILDKSGPWYFLDAKGRILSRVARGWFIGTYGYESVFHNLEALLRKEKEYGKEVRRLSEPIARGSAEMEALLYFPLAIDIIRRNKYKRVLDLGCGEGTFLRALCTSLPEVEGAGMDLSPESVEAARERAARAGLEGRLRFYVGDVAEGNGAPAAEAKIDAATIFFVMHEILYRGEAAAVDFLQGFRRKFPGVPLIVFEVLRPSVEDMRRRPGMAIHYALQHDLSHQKLVSGDEWKRLFQKAGFARIEARELSFLRTAIYTLS